MRLDTKKLRLDLHAAVAPMLNILRWGFQYKVPETDPLFAKIAAAIDALDELMEWEKADARH